MLGANGFLGNDIDLFIYALIMDEANEKIQEIVETLKKNGLSNTILISQHSITILGFYHSKHVQIVLRLYK